MPALSQHAVSSAWLGKGLARVILGTVAVRDPGLVQEACRRFPGRIVLGIDARGGRVAVAGWAEAGALGFFAQVPDSRSVSVTCITVPEGTDIDAMRAIARERFGVAIAGALGPLQGKAFRIGHLGDSNAATILVSAAYDASTGVLSVAGANMTPGDTIAVSQLTLTGQGGSYTLTTAVAAAQFREAPAVARAALPSRPLRNSIGRSLRSRNKPDNRPITTHPRILTVKVPR